MSTIRIVGGRVIDPSQGIDRETDLWIAGGRIHSLGPANLSAQQTIDATGLLVVPGLILITFWSLGAPSIVVEDEDPIGAFRRSWHLVSGNAWSVFGVLLTLLLIVFAIRLILTAIAVPIGDAAIVIAWIIAGAATAPVFALAASVMFFELGGGAPAPASEPPAAP